MFSSLVPTLPGGVCHPSGWKLWSQWLIGKPVSCSHSQKWFLPVRGFSELRRWLWGDSCSWQVCCTKATSFFRAARLHLIVNSKLSQAMEGGQEGAIADKCVTEILLRMSCSMLINQVIKQVVFLLPGNVLLRQKLATCLLCSHARSQLKPTSQRELFEVVSSGFQS